MKVKLELPLDEHHRMNSGVCLPKVEPLPGSLHREMKSCGDRGCRCARGHLHGPYWYRRWKEGNRQRKQYVSKHRLQEVEVAIKLWCELHPPAWQIRQGLAQLRRLDREVLKWAR